MAGEWAQRSGSAMGGDVTAASLNGAASQQAMSKSVSCSSDGGLARKSSLLASATAGMVPSRSALHLSNAAHYASKKASAGEIRPLLAASQERPDEQAMIVKEKLVFKKLVDKLFINRNYILESITRNISRICSRSGEKLFFAN